MSCRLPFPNWLWKIKKVKSTFDAFSQLKNKHACLNKTQLTESLLIKESPAYVYGDQLYVLNYVADESVRMYDE
jgi:hypothetical protein